MLAQKNNGKNFCKRLHSCFKKVIQENPLLAVNASKGLSMMSGKILAG